jgi:hypothetical protein
MPALVPLNTIPAAPGVYPILNLQGTFSSEISSPSRGYLILSSTKGPINIPTRVTSLDDLITQFDLTPATPTILRTVLDAVQLYFDLVGNLSELYVTRTATNDLAGFTGALNGFDPEIHSHGFICAPGVYTSLNQANRVAFQLAADNLCAQFDYQWVNIVDATLPTESYAASNTTLPDGRVIAPSLSTAIGTTVVPTTTLATQTQTQIANAWITESALYTSAEGHSWYYCNAAVNSSNRLVPLSLAVTAVATLRYYREGFRVNPAGQKAPIRTATDTAIKLNPANLSALNAAHCNVARRIAGTGVCIMGSRTLYKLDSAWRFCHVRVIFNVLSAYLRSAYQSTVFDPIDGQGVTFIRAKQIADQVCTRLWQAGALYGQSPSDAFLVKCDSQNNPATDLELGRLRVDVWAAPCGVAERVLVGIYRVPIGQVPQ